MASFLLEADKTKSKKQKTSNNETKNLQQHGGSSLSYLTLRGQCHALKEDAAQVMGGCVLAPCTPVSSTICVQRAVWAKCSQGAKASGKN